MLFENISLAIEVERGRERESVLNLQPQLGVEFLLLSKTVKSSKPNFRTFFATIVKQMTAVVQWIMWLLSKSNFPNWLLVGSQLERSQLSNTWAWDVAKHCKFMPVAQWPNFDHSFCEDTATVISVRTVVSHFYQYCCNFIWPLNKWLYVKDYLWMDGQTVIMSNNLCNSSNIKL